MSRTPRFAQEVMREALQRAVVATVTENVRGKRKLDAPTRTRELSKFELRVLVALIALVPLHDRAADHVAVLQIVRFLELPEGDTKPALNARREIRRALAALHQAGVIYHQPGVGQRASFVSFEGGTAPPLEGGTSASQRGVNGASKGGGGTPHPKYPKDPKSCARGDAPPSYPSPHPNPFELDDNGMAVRVS